MNEYLGIFDVPYVECIIIKIEAGNRETADNKFMNYLLREYNYKEYNGQMYVVPLFGEFETI